MLRDGCVLADPYLSQIVYSAADVRLVVEITSPGNLATDCAIKPQLYAQAAIPHYLRIEVQRAEPTALVFALGGNATSRPPASCRARRRTNAPTGWP